MCNSLILTIIQHLNVRLQKIQSASLYKDYSCSRKLKMGREVVILSCLLVMALLSDAKEKPGECPPVPADMAVTCGEKCSQDDDCMAETKCCATGCGHVCMIPSRAFEDED